jgi:tripartite ATP-independent transporter DctP family solute receptor
MKKFISLALVFCMLFTLAACGGGAQKPQGGTEQPGQDEKPAAKDATVLKFNSVLSSSDVAYGFWSDFGQDIADSSNGTIEVEMYPTEALGKTTDMIQAISKGAPILQDCDPSHLADYVPDYSVYMHPYLFKEPNDIEQAWKSEVGERLGKQLEDKGLRIVTMVYFGTRHLLSDRAVTKREDAAGMKIRCAPTKMWNEVAKVLGGNPTNTAWSETYTALSQGVADGAESPLPLLYSAKLHEARKHLSLTGHLVAITSIVMSNDVYKSLPEDGQKAIDEVGRAYPKKRIELITPIEQEFREKMEAEGVVFNEVDKTGFIEASKEVQKQFPEWTPGLVDEILEAIKD